MPARRKLLWAAVVVAFVLAAFSAASEGGFRRYARLNGDLATLREKNARLAEQNARLISEIQSLQQSPAAQEQAAREELGFVRPHELVLSFEAGK